MKVAIIGGGIIGLTLGYSLIKEGHNVTILEKNSQAGGQARSLKINDFTIERYYHCILGSDLNVISLIKELGINDKLFFVDATSGCYSEGKIYPMSKPADFLTFPPLSFFERSRLALGSQYIRLVPDWKALDNISLKGYLEKIYGKKVYNKFWKYLFKAKFDRTVDKLSATYIWSRVKRISSSDQKLLGWDKIGYLRNGGYSMIVNKLNGEIEKNGGKVLLNKNVKKFIIEKNKIKGIELEDGIFEADKVISTIDLDSYKHLFPDGYDDYQRSLDIDYMNIICVMLISKKKLTPYHTLYILDENIPFTGIIEMTNLIDPSDVGGKNIIYLSKYISPGNPYFDKPSQELIDDFVSWLIKMFPEYDISNIEQTFCSKEKSVEPVHCIGSGNEIPVITPVEELYLINSSQIHPKIPHCNALIELAGEAIKKLN